MLENNELNSETIKDQMSQEPIQKLRRRNSKGLSTPVKPGMEKLLNMTPDQFVKNYYERKRLLTVPAEIAKANPDKHFVYLDMNQLQKNGMYHPGGYTLYKVTDDPQNMHNLKFNQSTDGLIHRNELVLAYISKEEQEYRQVEEEIVRGRMKLEDVFTQQDFAGSPVNAKSKIEVRDMSDSLEKKVDSKLNTTFSLG